MLLVLALLVEEDDDEHRRHHKGEPFGPDRDQAAQQAAQGCTADPVKLVEQRYKK